MTLSECRFKSLQGGVTIVQIQEKNMDTAEVKYACSTHICYLTCLQSKEFIQIALDSQAICKGYNVPMVINDRIDVALAIQADGVHLGQTDMPVAIA